MKIGKDLVSLKDIAKIDLVYPNVNKNYKWFGGQEEITEKHWYDTRIIQEKITEGWYDSYRGTPTHQSDIQSERYLNKYGMYIDLEFEGDVMNRGSLTIWYKNSSNAPYTVYSRDKAELDDYFNVIQIKVGGHMLMVDKK